MQRKQKYPIESTTKGFPELEKALFVANDEIGWKSLTAFLVKWTNKHQPKDTNYNLHFWLNQCKNYKP